MFICECASYTYMCPHTYTHAYLYMAHIHVHTHTKFGLKSLAVHVALIPVALILGFLLRKPLSMIALPGMPWNNPTIHWEDFVLLCVILVKLKFSVFLLFLRDGLFLYFLSQGLAYPSHPWTGNLPGLALWIWRLWAQAMFQMYLYGLY